MGVLGHGGTCVVQGRGRAVDYRSGGGATMTLLGVGRREGGYDKEKKVRVCVRGREKEGCVFVRWAEFLLFICLVARVFASVCVYLCRACVGI